jgi:hypothetical protein
MPTFLFNAVIAKTDEPVKAYITLGGVGRGFTPDQKNQYLKVELSQTGTYNWHAKRNNSIIAKGESNGGYITVYID